MPRAYHLRPLAVGTTSGNVRLLSTTCHTFLGAEKTGHRRRRRPLAVAAGRLHRMHAFDSMLCMQYTIRNIPPELDRIIKARAKKLGKSVNQVALELLAQGTGQAVRYRSLRDMPGAWSEREAAQLDRFLQEHRRIDPELWK